MSQCRVLARVFACVLPLASSHLGTHSVLAQGLKREGIDFVQADNAFLRIDDLPSAQALADALSPDVLHKRLDVYAQWLCPILDVFGQTYHWSIRQIEYSTDLMSKSAEILTPLYDSLSRQSVLAADAPRVASFLGKKITPVVAQEIGSRLSTRIEGRCIKHCMGSASVKIYDKFGRVLRIETTVNDVSFFKHHRKVEHKDGHSTRELAAFKKSIYSLIDLREILRGCNQRYLAFLGSLDDTSAGQRDLQRLSQPRVQANTEHSVKGLNFFNPAEQRLLQTLQHGEFNIHGWCRADLIPHVPLSASALSRQLARLRTLGLIKKVVHTYRYYLTCLGRAAIAAACSRTRFNIIPAMAAVR